MSFRRVILGLVFVAAASPWAGAQGLIVDRDARHFHVPIARVFEIREVSVDARIRDQVAEVQVSQTFHNPGSFQIESEYFFPLPEEGAIQNFVLMVDGKELPGRLLPKDEARRIYEDIVRTRRDPALLEYMGRGLFKTSVFPIPPGADRKVTMRYTQLCKRERDVVEFSYPLSTQKFTAKPIQRLALNLSIQSRDAIKSTYSPTYDTRVDRSGDHDVRVSFEQREVTPATDFRLVYTLAEGALGASVLSYRPSGSDDGYFLVLASPQVKPPDRKPQPKTVVFVLDRSGSMAGKKIEQAKKALGFVLNNLRDDDLFNIVVYDDRVESFQPELQRFTSETRRAAERFVENIREGGSTNIDSALKAAMGMIQSDDRPSYVLFLTDGLPTAGETRELSIADDCRQANAKHARLFAFGVGFDVNARLLDRLSGGNSGTSEYVQPGEDIESHVARFYSKMTSPVLSDIRIELTGVDVNRTYPRDIPDLFEGGQFIWVGRYRQSNRTHVRLSGKVAGERSSFEFPADLAEVGRGTSYDFVEKLWAARRVGFIIDEVDLRGPNKELIDELVGLSTRYGILTPYTSFLADERVPLHAQRQNSQRAGDSLSDLNMTTGQGGVAQRSLKKRLTEAEQIAAPVTAASPPPTTAPAASGPGQIGGFGSRVSGEAKVAARPRGMMGGGSGGNVPALGVAVEDASGNKSVVGTVRQIGSKTFYRKGDRWVDSTVTPDEEAKATAVAQFSDAFFVIARAQKAELNQYLTFDEPVTVNLDGKVYRFEQAKH
ncbi:MAG: VIT domain-containing protein [Isosphaeraceae bacterium]|nr:VIT domain-containing protein [Isosphaeraceae bacterium]